MTTGRLLRANQAHREPAREATTSAGLRFVPVVSARPSVPIDLPPELRPALDLRPDPEPRLVLGWVSYRA